MIRVFVGYDSKEVIAYSVLSHSIEINASEPVTVAPVMLSQLKDIYTRKRNNLSSTEFSFSRFIVPFLCDYKGWAIFMDCDMLVRSDIKKLWDLRDNNYAVKVVKHDHKPTNDRKFLDQPQTKYEKKNWSSVMLLNCERCKRLTPEYVNNASGLELHQFKWLEDESLIGELPHGWNHLVGYDSFDLNAMNVHFTEGGPYFDEYKDCEYSDEWRRMRSSMMYVENRVLSSMLKRS